MSEKRFTLAYDSSTWWAVRDGDITLWKEEVIATLNELQDENEKLKQANKDAIQILKKEFDFASEERQKYLDDPVVATAYDIIRYDMRRALDKLGDVEWLKNNLIGEIDYD